MILNKKYNPIVLIVIGLFALLILWINFHNITTSQIQESFLEKPEIEEQVYVALVLDDFGYNLRNIDELKKMSVPITFAVLPDAPFTRKICEIAGKNKIEIILHLPLEPENENISLEENTITLDMERTEIEQIVEKSFENVFAALGASNHMGSKATKDPRVMRIVMEKLKKLNKYYLDSYTANSESCRELARKYGVKYLRRDIFLDNENNPEKIKEQFIKLIDVARERKYAIGIGHDRASTVAVLAEIAIDEEFSDIKFVYLSELMNTKKDKK